MLWYLVELQKNVTHLQCINMATKDHHFHRNGLMKHMCCREVSNSELRTEKLWGMWMTPARRAPFGWCMAAIFVQKRWCRASFILGEGDPLALEVWNRLCCCTHMSTVKTEVNSLWVILKHLIGCMTHDTSIDLNPFEAHFLHLNLILLFKIKVLVLNLTTNILRIKLWRCVNILKIYF